MDMLVKLYDLPDSRSAFARLREAGIDVRRALAPEKHKVIAWVHRTFSEGWASEAEVAFSRHPVSCFIAVDRGNLAGFACHDATCPNFFGPTGVEPVARKKGIGAALLFACLEDMRQAGYGYAIIGGVGPADFYSRTVGAIAIEGSEPGIYRGLL
ncbi:MAG: GNAT family N-acetyltransferase [Bradyrhizobium sp.]|nr:GNAT family N-acetyltransferase [Bradyrhizobium sp.]MBU6459242.1 GNAT family N-acetyltransferase [Bradyrhizobium sp.]MDE2602034.1 GNAT family N-acetyltransferase [Bradyrhizobium sp.]